ncbi:MAG: Asp-tRNA(Asn)/Glu-tRNA(Gln) amidotransferase subunit GatA [Thiotrichaceae bacterium]|nr:Asp-tRNA(Asn)/Glu-tRNA(Gln) amidotransferase subunit GatA [Thiotrichaceae bacterium]
MHTKTISQLSAVLRSGEVSSVELTSLFLDRIKQHNLALNCFISITEAQALEAAAAADQRLKAGNAAPLTGVPIAHKDIFCTEGVKTTCGSKMLDNFIAPYESTCTAKFRDAGAVMLGKTNMDEFAMGSSNETSYFGAVKNPWDQGRVPGGSSGGSVSAVAARLAPAATGTDTGGSIRQPAALCGLTGLKPTYGRVSRFGMIAFASSLDQAGPVTYSAEDAALMMNVMAGFDERDSTSVAREVPDYSANLENGIEGLKIGLPKEYFGEGLDGNIARVIDAAIKEYEALGAVVKEISLPNTGLAVPTYYVVAPAECSTNLSRFDGVRFGHRCDDPQDLFDLYTRSRGEGFGLEVKRRIMIGTYVLSAGYYDAYYLKAQKIRRLISDDFRAAFEKVDVIMGPTTPSTAFKLGEKADDPVTMYLSDIYTIAVNMAGLPAASIPAGFVDGLPVGLQVIGNYFDESRLLNVAHKYQQATDWHLQVPKEFQ